MVAQMRPNLEAPLRQKKPTPVAGKTPVIIDGFVAAEGLAAEIGVAGA